MAYRLDELGVRTGLAAPISSDIPGKMLEAMVEQEHPRLDFHPIGGDGQRLSIVVNLIGRRGVRRVYFLKNNRLEVPLTPVARLARRYAAVHISGYMLELATPAEMLKLVSRLKSDGLRVSLDLHPRIWKGGEESWKEVMELFNSFDILFGTENEFEKLIGTKNGRELSALFSEVPELVIKRGPRGATLAGRAKMESYGAPSVVPVSVKGAGDALIASYLWSRLEGAEPGSSLAEAVKFASSAITRSVPRATSQAHDRPGPGERSKLTLRAS